jgi:hypothetical protein
MNSRPPIARAPLRRIAAGPLRRLFAWLAKGTYRPERHYMRGTSAARQKA